MDAVTNSIVLLTEKEILRKRNPFKSDEENPSPPVSLACFHRNGLVAGSIGR
jgi:hypothetical protein